MDSNHYEILGCQRNATQKEIKSAYHRLIAKYHPDRNPDPRATQYATRLNEAYSVLRDERQRALYDAWIDSQRRETRTEASSPEIPPIKCKKCGRQDETLRLAVFYYVISLVFMTSRKGAADIWCQQCRLIEGAKWTFVTGLLGWWGFPWGPIYTIHALFINAFGGLQPKPNNAAILRVLGYQLYQQGRIPEALASLEYSLKLESNVDAAQLRDYLYQQNIKPFRKSRMQMGRIAAATIAPSLLIVSLVSYGIYAMATAPSGYEAHYSAPADMPAGNAQNSATESDNRHRVNGLVDQLAALVESRSPVVGVHYEGSKKIQDHELDRSKFDETELYLIAQSIGSELHANSNDTDGFLASAYFNAQLFAASVDLIKRLDQGKPIDDQIVAVLQLNEDPTVSKWLENSRFHTNYSALCIQLRSYSHAYHPGLTTNQLANEYDRTKVQVEEIKNRLDQLKSVQDSDSYNALVPEYNSSVRDLNALAKRGRFQAQASRKLDLAFNRCLDSGILMSKFEAVNLTSHAAEIDPINPLSQ